MVKIKKTAEFDEWLLDLRIKEQAQIEARLYRIEAFNHFGNCKPLEGTGDAILENGWRIYFYREGHNTIRLLWVGKKNDQKEDIKKAKVLLRRYADFKK